MVSPVRLDRTGSLRWPNPSRWDIVRIGGPGQLYFALLTPQLLDEANQTDPRTLFPSGHRGPRKGYSRGVGHRLGLLYQTTLDIERRRACAPS